MELLKVCIVMQLLASTMHIVSNIAKDEFQVQIIITCINASKALLNASSDSIFFLLHMQHTCLSD